MISFWRLPISNSNRSRDFYRLSAFCYTRALSVQIILKMLSKSTNKCTLWLPPVVINSSVCVNDALSLYVKGGRSFSSRLE